MSILNCSSDPRIASEEAGRSINLALSVRGINALKMVNIHDYILARCYPMKGRLIHKISPSTMVTSDVKIEEQLYGLSDERINSVDRKMLNIELIKKAETTGKVQFIFGHECIDIDFDLPSATFYNKYRARCLS